MTAFPKRNDGSESLEMAVAQPIDAAMGSRPTLSGWAVTATVAGNALEFYDFLAYSTFAVYIGQAFFPAANPLTGLLLSLATFGVGFVTRPLGGLLIGAYADRAGRRPALLLTLSLMTVGTLALVLTPTYASIGLAAPSILIMARLLQGLALGGEVGPATAVLLECAPPRQRGRYVSWQGASQGMAVLAAGCVGYLLSISLGQAQLAAWGWRLSFALGLLIVPVGLSLRRRLPETLQAPGSRRAGAVLEELWRTHRKPLLLAVMIIMCLTISTYVTNYMTTFALTALRMPASQAMWATIANGALMVAGGVAGGRLCDRYGRKLTMILPRLVMLLAVYPAFLYLLRHTTTGALVIVTGLLTLLGSLSAAGAYTALTEAFPNQSRSSGIAVAYALSVSVFGGTTQFVLAWLIGTSGDRASPAYYVIVTSLISLWAMFRLPADAKEAS
jgi:MFS family permease